MNPNQSNLSFKENPFIYTENFSGLFVMKYAMGSLKSCESRSLNAGEYCIFVQDGRGDVDIDGQPIAYQKHDFFFFRARSVQIMPQTDSEYAFLQMGNGRFLLENQSILQVQQANWAAMRMEYIDRVLQSAQGDPYQLSADIYALIMDAWRAHTTQKKQFSSVVQAAMMMIHQNFAYIGGVEELADALSCNKSTFIRRFKAETGQSPGQYLQTIRMENAKILLKSQSYSIELIANMTGYACANYFCKAFLKRIGESPGHYRKRYSGMKMSREEKEQMERIEKNTSGLIG